MTGISRMLDFLTALKVNNDRQWFAAHKEEYNDIRVINVKSSLA